MNKGKNQIYMAKLLLKKMKPVMSVTLLLLMSKGGGRGNHLRDGYYLRNFLFGNYLKVKFIIIDH